MTGKQLVVVVCVFLWALAAPARAQDAPTITDINYGDTVTDTISADAIFDWWQVQTAPGDQLVVEMAASDGLAPLLAILTPGGDVAARSDDGAPDATLTLEFTAPAEGVYTIVATRVGGPDGSSTGAYTLRLRRANAAPTRPDIYQDVTFRCRDFEAAAAASITFAEDPKPDMRHRVTVYGIDGFKPVIRLTFTGSPDFEDCNADAERTAGDSFTLPGEAARTITADARDNASQVTLAGAENMRQITLTIASRSGQPGRYVALIEGFTLERGDVDGAEIRLGPLSRLTPLTVYMVATPNSRLDPQLYRPDLDISCDDAGRRGCEDVPSFAGAGFTLNESTPPLTITGDRNDAGLLLAPGTTEPIILELGSRSRATYGDYVLVLIGELPPRE